MSQHLAGVTVAAYIALVVGAYVLAVRAMTRADERHLAGQRREPGRPARRHLLPADERDRAALDAAVWDAVHRAGHGGCGSWTYDDAELTVTCSCGGLSFGVEEVGSRD